MQTIVNVILLILITSGLVLCLISILKKRNYVWAYYSLFLVFVVSRIHVVFNNVEMDFDESMILSQAVTLKLTGGYFWDKLHGGSVGVLNTYQLLAFNKIGFPISYSTAHLISLVLSSITLVALFKAIRNYTNSAQTALLGLLPTLVFYVIGQDINFVHLSSEQFSISLFSVVIYGYTVICNKTTKDRTSTIWFLIAGLLLGMIPYSKLQSSLLVVFVALMGILVLIKRKGDWKNWFAFIFGGLFFSFLNFAILLRLNALEVFWERYILDNIAYINDVELGKQVVLFATTIVNEKALLIFVLTSLLLFIFGLKPKDKIPLASRNIFRQEIVLTLVFLVITVYTINKPGNYFLHYYLYLVLPLTVLNALVLRDRVLLQKYVLLGIALAGIGVLIIRYDNFLVNFDTIKAKKTEVEIKIAPYFLSKNDYLTEFGRFGKHNVLLQQPQGTAMNFFEGMYNSRKERLLEELIVDIKRNRPIVLLEHNRWSQFETTTPQFMPYLNQNYEFIGEYMSENDQEKPDSTMKEKIYVRKDRYREIHKTK